jgi:putative heme-binding domain-containing protein
MCLVINRVEYNLPASMRTLLIAAAACLLAAGPLVAQNAPAEHPEQYPAADVAAGAALYNRLCVNCHGPSGTGIGGIDLHRGVLPRARTDAALQNVITTGFPQAGMPAFRLQPAELKVLIAYVRAGADFGVDTSPVTLGDAALGRAIFAGKGKCLSCHRVGEEGSFAAPELTDVGRLRTAVAIRRTLLDPTAFMRPINRPVRAVTRDGEVIAGRRLNEDSFTVQLITDQGRLVSLVKSELKEWTVSTTSTMPSYKEALTPAELADLLAYLMSLKG